MMLHRQATNNRLLNENSTRVRQKVQIYTYYKSGLERPKSSAGITGGGQGVPPP